MARLPVSGLDVILREPTGEEETLLLDARECDSALALALTARLAQPADGAACEWESVCVTDFEALLLMVRRHVFGDHILTDVRCPAEECGARIDVDFRITDYLAHHRPRRPRGVERSDEAGWFRFRDAPVSFRLPTPSDQIAVAGHPQSDREAIRRCVLPVQLSPRMLRRVENALEALAPSLSHEAVGKCPECEATVSVYFDVQRFTLQELRDRAKFLYEEVHLLAGRYHWPETAILALPAKRRAGYAELIRQEGGS
ncbi:MAG: hypothetical protein Q7T82_08145 [Armatimonadota bacterium]|nr:hypothetical protein [Armatimonadota bacterium]